MLFAEGLDPNWITGFCADLPAPATGEHPDWEFYRAVCTWSDSTATEQPEDFAMYASSDQVRVTEPFGDIPLVVLTADDDFVGEPGSPKESWGEYHKKAQQAIAAPSAQGQYKIIEGTDYGSIYSNPETWNAIVELVKAIQSK